ncbi:hypothetical protein NE237_007428 [Protea cynaroides]|uniref:Uncharacterized protein n=1 Tax=Protea cynaroides TaxID=273540 RepID=A0A9Q0KPH4_9MAGN|nr:hypothetical protein NE237_007428 [Protea cynaroides]
MDRSELPILGSLKKYLSRRTYQRLDGGFTVKRNVRVMRLGGKGRRSWKIRGITKLHLKITSPIMKILVKLRDGYINMMLGFAGNVNYMGDTKTVFEQKRIPKGRSPIPSVSKLQEFDTKLILQVYNSIAVSRELVAY